VNLCSNSDFASTTESKDNRDNSQDYSALDAYLKQHESHEHTALARGTAKKKKAVRKHKAKMKEYIEETSKTLSK
jgi:hypothetical protein